MRWNEQTDVVVVGGGVIGLSLALELRRRGLRVTVLEGDRAAQQATSAAAGMLAVDDPHNPAALLELSRYSAGLYPEFLARVEALSGRSVPFQTDTTVQYLAGGDSVRLAERSLDPRQLAAALVAAVATAQVELREETRLEKTEVHSGGVRLLTDAGDWIEAGQVVHANGAWAGRLGLSVVPRKGQMLRVQMTEMLREVHRSEHVYVVPRHHGPQAGTALIGSTIEDAGFDTTTQDEDLQRLRAMAAAHVPSMAAATQVEAWAGLRPATPDGLPLMDRIGEREFVASGHFRNGILLAPGTAVAMADFMEGTRAAVGLEEFRAGRFQSVIEWR